jgi:hypothetical protein
MPAQVLLFRHAEKPDAASDMGLSPRGQIRAAALAVYLPAVFGRPSHLVAAHELLGNPRYQGARIALCWHHGEIADLARALQAADAPDHWDPDVFDHIWQIDYGLDHPKLTKVHQKLLYGDSD